MTAPTWTPCTVTLGTLQPWARNPRLSTKAQAKRILASFARFGQVQAVAIGPENEVYDGHQRLSALLTVHGPDYAIDARRSNRPLDDDERRALVLTLHAGATGAWNWDDLAGWDAAQLQAGGLDAEYLKTLNADAAALAMMLEAEQPPAVDAEPQIDRAEELRVKWGVEPGQLWKLGEHRLICGDCTDKEVVEKVLQGEKPTLMVTDPPYGVDYDPMFRQEALGAADRRAGRVENDDRSDWSEAWALFPGDVVYCWSAMRTANDVLTSFAATGFDVRAEIIWSKSHFPFGRGHYVAQHEACWYLVRDGGTAHWKGDGAQSTVWKIDLDETADGQHGTQKPLECMERPIRNHEGDVYEPFSGSGTTIIACERLGRRCRAVEISPAYVAVALERWAQATGGTPELVEP